MTLQELLKAYLLRYTAQSLEEAAIPWGASGEVFFQNTTLPLYAPNTVSFKNTLIGNAQIWDRRSADFPQAAITTSIDSKPTYALAIGGSMSVYDLTILEAAYNRNIASSAASTQTEYIRNQRKGAVMILNKSSHEQALYGSPGMPGFLNNAGITTEVLAIDPYTADFTAVFNWVMSNSMRVSVATGAAMNTIRILTNPTLYLRFLTLANAVGTPLMSILNELGIQVIGKFELYGAQLQAKGIGAGSDRAYFFPYGSEFVYREISQIFQSPVVSDIYNLNYQYFDAMAFGQPSVSSGALIASTFTATTTIIQAPG